jgi:hypothetical protein
MTQLWPRLGPTVARTIYHGLRRRTIQELASGSRPTHDRVTYAATGGRRVPQSEIIALTDDLRRTAHEFGYPKPAEDAQRIAFDRAGAEVLYARMDITSVEAAHNGVWNFLALVAAPDLVLWRWTGSTNVERWICTDRTRHMFARLWWQALTFHIRTEDERPDHSLLRSLSESDLNQITERRSIAGNPRLAQAVARMLASAPAETRRRDLLRTITPRLRRRLAFIDFAVLTDEQLDDHLRALARDA